MPVKVVESNLNVLQAAKIRIRNVFANGCKIYLSFSSGKDSLCMANLVYEMILSGELDPKQLTVTFIDEEGLYPSMVDAAYRWRRNFLSVGAKFLWFCLPFKQVSVIDHLSSSESWITWEPGKEDVWMRKPPDFAIMYSPYLHYAGEMNYQTFCSKAFSDGIQLVGLRTAESLTRFKCIANTKMERITRGGKFYPIYDWKDSDVWLYIKERNLEFPEIYMRLYEAGVRKNALRLCAFFGDCGTQGLRWIAETDNDLWERIQRREPNAYLVLLYWDSEMFRRTTRKRGELEEESEKKDYKALCKDLLFLHPERYTIAKDTLSHIEHWRGLFIKTYGIAEQKHYKTMYEGLLYGDPKMRILRILWTTIPYESPSNKTVHIDGLCDDDGNTINLTYNQALVVDAAGICTFLNFMGGWTAWGNHTACYPKSTDVKDYFIPLSRMFDYVSNTLIKTFWSKLDKPMNRRLIDTILDSANIWLNGLVGAGYLLGARVEMLENENPLTSLMAGKIKLHVYMTPPSPAQEIDFVLEYDADYVTSALQS